MDTKGKVTLLDCSRAAVIDRLSDFSSPGCRLARARLLRLLLGADQVAHLAHLNARDTTLAYASRAPENIERLKARMGWKLPWFTTHRQLRHRVGVDQWHGDNAFHPRWRQSVPHILHQRPR